MSRPRGRALLALASVVLLATAPAAARLRKLEKSAIAPAPAPPPPATTKAVVPPDARPYDGQIMRLAEVLGALTTMRQVCGSKDADQWRTRMETLLEAEGNPPSRKDRLAGAFNRGLRGYALTYRSCTPNARLVIKRFLEESSRLARDLGNRYRAS